MDGQGNADNPLDVLRANLAHIDPRVRNDAAKQLLAREESQPEVERRVVHVVVETCLGCLSTTFTELPEGTEPPPAFVGSQPYDNAASTTTQERAVGPEDLQADWKSEAGD